MMKVNASMLIHKATYLQEKASTEDPAFGKPTVIEHVLEKIRVEYLKHGIAYTQIRVDRADAMVLLFFPGTSTMDGAEAPLPEFQEGEKVRLQNGQTKTIKEVVENYDASRLHHLEVRLQ